MPATDAQKAAADALVGKTYGDGGVTDADVKAIADKNRVLVGDCMMTMDFVDDRLNVHVKQDTKVIERVNWG